MTRKTTEHSRRRDEEGPLENPTRERALAFIRRWDPELNQTITEHANRSIHHSQAAWTKEPVTLSFDRDGAAVEVTNQDSTAFRIFEAMRDTAREHSSREEKTQAARELVEMMTQPYRMGLENLPPEQAALRDRLEGNLGRIAGEAADCLTLEAEAHSPTGEMFCNQTENMAAISRDLSRAASGMEDFDGALVKRNRTLWEKLRQGDSTLDLFPINGQENPRPQSSSKPSPRPPPGGRGSTGRASRMRSRKAQPAGSPRTSRPGNGTSVSREGTRRPGTPHASGKRWARPGTPWSPPSPALPGEGMKPGTGSASNRPSRPSPSGQQPGGDTGRMSVEPGQRACGPDQQTAGAPMGNTRAPASPASYRRTQTPGNETR